MSTKVRQLTRDDYEAFIRERPFAVIHFDAEWDVGGRPLMRLVIQESAKLYDEQVNFGEIDCDQELDLARSIPVLNVPLIAYYRNGRLVAGLIGNGQNVVGRLQRLMRGESIGSDDGTGMIPMSMISRDQLYRDQEEAVQQEHHRLSIRMRTTLAQSPIPPAKLTE